MNGSTSAIIILLYVALIVVEIAAMWRVFTKAGAPGWGSIIPIYNTYLLCKIAGRPGWWVLLYFIPFVNFVIHLIVMLDVAKAFGRGAGFGVGLTFLPFIFFPILGFGDAQYRGANQLGYAGAPSY